MLVALCAYGCPAVKAALPMLQPEDVHCVERALEGAVDADIKVLLRNRVRFAWCIGGQVDVTGGCVGLL